MNTFKRISSTDSKLSTALYRVINSTTRKKLLSSFDMNGHTLENHPQTDHLVQHNQHRKVLFSSFHMNGSTLDSKNWNHLVQHTPQEVLLMQ